MFNLKCYSMYISLRHSKWLRHSSPLSIFLYFSVFLNLKVIQDFLGS